MSATILAVDDDPDALVLVAATLDRAGYQVVTSSAPAEIEALALEHGVDALVLDVVMPDLSGHDVLRSLRENPRTGGLPVLLLSARADGPDRVDGLRQGADDFLGKPFEPEELVLRIERLIAPYAPERTEARSHPGLERTMKTGRVEGRLFLGRYQAIEVIGEGGTGTVFRGWDPKLKRPVALKTLYLGEDAPPNARHTIKRLLDEAVTIARFNHPNIVTVYDVGDGADVAFIAMEYVDGTSLGSYLDLRGPLVPETAAGLALGIAQGLAAAHARGVIHRDVKPGNVLLGVDGSVKVSDFGFAELASSLGDQPGGIFGTPGYLPPEMVRGEPYGPAGDIYSLGVLLYRALSGQLPIPCDTFHEMIRATLSGERTPLRAVAPQVPVPIESLCEDLLADDPAARPPDGAAVVELLEALGVEATDWRIDAETVERIAPDRERTLPTPLRTPIDPIG